jgi:putative membrane protein
MRSGETSVIRITTHSQSPPAKLRDITMPAITVTNPAYRTPPSIIAAIIAISAVASLFIFWLVYIHPPVDTAGTSFRFLPALNATLNALCTVFLLFGLHYIKARRIIAHRNSMFGAFLVSAAFLVSYLATYFLHGETRLPIAHTGALWYTYAIILFATHIPLAIIALPLILITFFLSLTGRFPAHRRLARWTYPIWLYVSVSGVFVYLLQAVVHK